MSGGDQSLNKATMGTPLWKGGGVKREKWVPENEGILRITSQRLLDQSQASPYIGENATYPFWAFLSLNHL